MAMLKLDRERALRFTVAAARKFKEVYGTPLWRVRLKGEGEPLPEIVDPVCLTHVLWAGLITEDPKLTVSNVERYFDQYLKDGGDIADVYEAIGSAFEQSGIFGKKEGGEEPPKA